MQVGRVIGAELELKASCRAGDGEDYVGALSCYSGGAGYEAIGPG